MRGRKAHAERCLGACQSTVSLFTITVMVFRKRPMNAEAIEARRRVRGFRVGDIFGGEKVRKWGLRYSD